jgi:uncharacterized protein
MKVFGRQRVLYEISESLRRSPVTALLGPRQCGKTHLARQFQVPAQNYFDLQAPLDRMRLENDAMAALSSLQGTVVIDEVQFMPELFPLLRVLSDQETRLCQFLILGSASPDLIRGASESLAGRVHFIDMSCLLLPEIIGSGDEAHHWLRGGYPRSLLAENDTSSFEWRLDYIRTFLIRDLPHYIQTRLSEQELYRLFSMIAHYHGQTWNHSKIASQVNLNYKTIQNYVDLFEGAYLLRCLPPYYNNMGKRLRQSPKYYLRDTGLLHALLQIQSPEQLQVNPRMGPSWEGYVLEHLIQILKLVKGSYFYWSVHNGPEIDLIIERPDGFYGFEFKASTSPAITDSMKKGIKHLNLKKLWIVYPGQNQVNLSPIIQLLPIRKITPDLFMTRS